MDLSTFGDGSTLTAGPQALQESFEEFLSGPERVMVVRGLAGSGKTHMIREFIRVMEDRHFCHHLAAPTGRAAKVLAEKQAAPPPPSTA